MTSFLLFCTAQIPSTTLDALLRTPQYDIFSLVRDPFHPTFDLHCTQPPVTPFHSGFIDYTENQIRDFIAAHLPETPSGTNLDPKQYAVLDERSARDNTVVIAQSYNTKIERDLHDMTEEERDGWEYDIDTYGHESDDAWREWRVGFEDAYQLSTMLAFESDSTVKLYKDEFVAAHTDEEGVLQIRSVLEVFGSAGTVEESA